MDYEPYMVMTSKWKKKTGQDPDSLMPTYSSKSTTIKCFKYGKTIFIRGTTSNTTISAMAYVITDPVKVGDILDDQVVKSVDNIPDFDGTFPLFQALTWET